MSKPKFDPNKPFTVVEEEKGKKPKFDPNKSYEVAPDDPPEEPSVLSQALETGINILDIPGAASRSVLMGKGKEHLQNIMEEGLIDASGMAPTEEDIATQAGIIDKESAPAAKFGASFATGMATDPTTYLSGGLVPLAKGALKRSLRGKMANTAARALSKIKPLTKTEAVGSGISTDVLGTALVQEDLARYIKKPRRLLEVLGGRRPVKITETSAGTMVKKGKDFSEPGLISEISKDLGDMISDVSTGAKGVSQRQLADPVSASLRDLTESKISGVRYSDRELAKMEEQIYNILDRDSYSLEDIYQLKKNIGRQLSSPIFFQPADKALSNSKEVMLKIQRHLDDVLENNLSKTSIKMGDKVVNAADYYKTQNNRMHNMINLRDVLQMVPEKELRDSSLPATMMGLLTQGAIGGATGAAIGAATDLPYGSLSGALLTGGLAGARQAGQAVTKGFPENATRTMDLMQRYAPTTIPLAPQGIREMRPENEGRSPQSLGGIESIPTSRNNLPLAISRTKLPRTVEGLLANKKVLLAKTAQQAPEYFDQVKFFVEERPEDLEQLLPMIMKLVPHAFESDKYGRVNGMILDPMMQQKAREDLMQDPNLTNTQRIQMIDKLNRTNELEDY